MKTKEMTFTLPLLICLYEYLFLRGKALMRFACLVPLLLTMLVIPLSILAAPDGGGYTVGHAEEVTRVGSDLSRGEYMLTELRVIVTYLRLIFLPVNQNLDYDYPTFHTLFTTQVFVSFLILLALFGLAVYLCYRSANWTSDQQSVSGFHSSRLIAFGIFWFFLTLSVESSIIPIADVIFEHRLYLSSVGAFIALAACWGVIRQMVGAKVKNAGAITVTLAAVIFLALAGATWARNEVWRTQESLWRDVVKRSPGKARGYQNLGIALFETGDLAGAFACFDKALAIDPEFTEAYINRGTFYAQNGLYDKAIVDFLKSIDIDPLYKEAWNNLGLAWSEMGNQDRAIHSLLKAVALNPDYFQAQNNLGLALTRKGSPGEAIAHFDRAIAINSRYAKAYYNRGAAYLAIGRPNLVGADFRKACALGDERGCSELRTRMIR
jgi:tetratricopeptide (TPR) repeat protein